MSVDGFVVVGDLPACCEGMLGLHVDGLSLLGLLLTVSAQREYTHTHAHTQLVLRVLPQETTSLQSIWTVKSF